MVNTRLTKEEKVGLIDRIFANRMSDDLVSFLCILAEKNRYSDVDGVLYYFVERVKEE